MSPQGRLGFPTLRDETGLLRGIMAHIPYWDYSRIRYIKGLWSLYRIGIIVGYSILRVYGPYAVLGV